MPSEAHYAKEACQMLIAGEGWRAFLAYMVERLAHLDAQLFGSAAGDPHKERLIGARNELVSLVHYVYRQANVPNPFETHRQALWSLVAPLAVAPVPQGEGALHETTEQSKARILAEMHQQRQRGGGGVA